MNEEEELYRLMNEEDDFYMGNKEDDRENDNKKTSNIGCIGMLLFMLFSGGAFICLNYGVTYFGYSFLIELFG